VSVDVEHGAIIGDRIEADGEDYDSFRATPELYDFERVGRFQLNHGLPVLKVQYSVLQETAPVIACLGSWRSGKTRSGALKTIEVAAANPWRPIYESDNPTSVVITETMKIVRDSAYRELAGLLPKELILREWKSTQHWRIRLVNGHDLIFRSWMSPFEGLSSICTWLDEAHKLDGPDGPHELWRNISTRATDAKVSRRQTIVTGLPEYGWLSEIFDQPNTRERATYLCSMIDNFYLYDENGESEVIRVLRASTTEEEAEVTIHGRWRKPETVIYYAFSLDGNLSPIAGDPTRSVDLSLDLGDKGAILVSQNILVWCRDQHGRKYRSAGVLIVDEMLPERMSVKDALRNFFAAKPWKLTADSRVYVDPKADRDELAAIREITGAGSGKPGCPRLVKKQAKEKGYSVEYGHRCVNSAFRDLDRNRRLFIYKGLGRGRRSLIPALLAHKRKPNGEPLRDNIVDHVLDALRYIIVDRLPLRSDTMRVMKQAA
jgi:hypothetical protein